MSEENKEILDLATQETANEITAIELEETIPTEKQPPSYKWLFYYSLFWSIFMLICAPIGAFISGEKLEIFKNYYYILITPSKLVTDYFNIGGVGSAFLNAGICGLFVNFIIYATKSKTTPTLLASYFLVIAHCFYGLNIINFLPPFLGVYVYSLVRKQKFSENLHIANFATSLAPFVSEFLFRYTISDYKFGTVHLTVYGVILALLFGILAGFIVPALLPGTTRMHRGYNLYKAGLAIGLLGLFVFAFLYKNFGFSSPEVVERANAVYKNNQSKSEIFINFVFATIFIGTLLLGFILNKKSFKNYNKLLADSGHDIDFVNEFGEGLTFINIGLYGIMILLYMHLIILFTDGVSFTAPTVGVIIASMTFTACGQHPKNVFPIIVGYIVHYLFCYLISYLVGFELSWSLSTQSYINGLAFATGLCPIAGKYGFKYGIIAGFLCAIICSTTSAMHGGFVLYNGGFSSGLTAMILIPILDFYNVKHINET